MRSETGARLFKSVPPPNKKLTKLLKEAKMKSVIKRTSPKDLTLEELKVYLYGPTKIGKTTFCSRLDGNLFIATEDGQSFIEDAAVVRIHNWKDFLTLLRDMQQHPGEFAEFKVFTVDTVDTLYRFCFAYVCKTLGIDYPRDGNFGSDWAAIKQEWSMKVADLLSMDKGIYFIGHSKMMEEVPRSGKFETFPMLPANGGHLIKSMCDFEFAALWVDKRVPTVLPSGKKGHKMTRVPRMLTRATVGSTAGNRLGSLPEEMDINFEEFEKEFFAALKESNME